MKERLQKHWPLIIAFMLIFVWAGLRAVSLHRPFWMDESSSAALAFQSTDMIVRVCQKDVHPPGYYLLLKGWNWVLNTTLGLSHPEPIWTLVDFNVSAIETTGMYQWKGPGGIIETPGVFLEEPIFWDQVPLAPLWTLRLLSIFFGALAMLFTFLLARMLFPASRIIGILVVFLFVANGYTLTWDTVIRSYSCGAAFTSALAVAGILGIRSGRLLLGGALVAILTAGAFLTNYPTIVVLPGVALLVFLSGGINRRSLVFTLASFSVGGLLILAMWGRSFLGQMGKVPSQSMLEISFAANIGAQFERVILDYWRMLFSEGIWHWLADRRSNYLDPLLNLSPVNPILYLVCFALYGGSIAAGFYRASLSRPAMLWGLALAAFLPAIIVFTGNVLKPGFFRIYARHLYPATPFFYLFISYGLAALFKPAPAAERPASQPVENAACRL